MKSAVETLSPTRVKLTVEVPFDELKPSLDSAYRKIGQQVRVKGFRPGKVPARVLDQYVGRGAVLEEAVNEALPRFYGDAVRENNVDILGHPEIEVTEFNDGDQLVFTATVDVRPEFELPSYEGLPVTVDDAEVDDARVDEQLQGLRDRFATLKTVERAAQAGDFVSIDLSATIDGEPVEDAGATNLSYEVGSDSLVRGLDEAITGLSAGESKEFETQLRSGDHGGEPAVATVTVRTVKEKEVPALDDDFAQTASEFDTIDELRGDIRERLGRIGRLQQGVQARDRALDALLERVDLPLPEHTLADEVAYRKQTMTQQLQGAGISREQYAEMEGTTIEELDADLEKGAEQAIRAQFVLDAIARKEELGVSEAELTDTIVRRAQQAGVRADDYAQQVVNSGQLGALMGEVLRGKALALVLEHATITDESGRPVNLDELTKEFEPVDDQAVETAGEAADVAVEAEPDDSTDSEPESS
ncbi:MAG TPA: trigger factor [Mycobacteriales bacterium]|jgi:trigger factor|nr:trigger factor [Mycobacteriales bacterium]